MSASSLALDDQPISTPIADRPQAPRLPLSAVVPTDPWHVARLVLFAAYAVGYLWFFITRGLIIDRISVGISVAIFILIGHIGRPIQRWAWLVFDIACYCVMWLAYEQSRGWADRAGFPLQVEAPRNIDRFLFFGTDPNIWMQRHFYDAKTIHWYDKVASATYFTHFIFPVVAIAVVWVTSHREWARFIKRFASLLFVGCITFILMPTAPPWMAADRKRYDFQIIGPLARHTSRGFVDMGMKGFVNQWQSALDWGNAVAAMPSLHAAFALFVPAFFLPRIRPVWLKAIVMLFPLMMLTALVYFGEHWVIDGIAGFVLVGLSFSFWGWFERRQRRVRAVRARAALVLGAGERSEPSRRRGRTTRSVLLDRSFVDAIVDQGDPAHDDSCLLYAELIDNYEAGTDRLFTMSTTRALHSRDVRRGPLGPVAPTWVARQHRCATAAVSAAGNPAATPEVALALVVMRRERLRTVATLLGDFDPFDVSVLRVPSGRGEDELESTHL